MPGKTINPRYYHFHPTAVAATTSAAPASSAIDVGTLVLLEELHLVIPSGHAGLTGIRIDYVGQTILPWSSPAQWLVGDGSDWRFDMGSLEVGAGLTAVMYNTDAITHGWDIQCKVRDPIGPNAGAGAVRAAVIL